MKRIITICSAILMTASVYAQAPETMSYQAVIRDASDNLVMEQAVGIQISILQGTAEGTAVYVETQAPITNANGLVSIEIGNGTVQSGDFASIDWANGPFFIKTETDPAGGTSYSITGTSQLLSVPYALYAKAAETADYHSLSNKPDLEGFATKDMGNENITNLADPVNAQDAVTKAYVDRLLENMLIDAGLFQLEDIDGNNYQIVRIGNQVWMAENLKVTKFNNEDDIPTGHEAEEWAALLNQDDGTGTPAYAQNPEAIPEDGLLYNWFAAADPRGLCPTGWRVPTDDDWKVLELFAGMSPEEVDLYTWRGADAGVGTKLKSTRRGMEGTDNYGFDAIPSGMRSGAGTYSTYGNDFFFWSSTEDPRDVATYYQNGVRRAVRNSRPDVIRQGNTKAGGYAVRCVRNIED